MSSFNPPGTPETPVETLWQQWRQDQCPDFDAAATEGPGADRALAVLRFDQYQRWLSGDRVPAEQYLQTYTPLKTDPDLAVILIYAEFLLRQELGETPTLDEYLQRFPAHAEMLREQHEFHEAVEGVAGSEDGTPAETPGQAGAFRSPARPVSLQELPSRQGRSSMHSPPLNLQETPGQTGLAPVPVRRHPLGLPAGSVRALLALMVFGIIWALLLLPERVEAPIRVPLYLYYLMFLILGHYFAARGHTPVVPGVREHPPLYLPRGSLRLLMILGFVAAMAWGFYQNPRFFDRLTPEQAADQPYLPLVLLAAFFLGIIVARVANRLLMGPQGLAPWFQDISAWISLMALLLLAIDFIIKLVINPTLAKPLELPHWEGFLAAVVGFYFGLKS